MIENLPKLLEASIVSARDSRREKEIIQILRLLPVTDACMYVEMLIDQKSPAALAIAVASISDRTAGGSIIKKKLPEADASSIRAYLKWAVKILGIEPFKHTISVLCMKNPGLWDKCAYWLPSIIGEKETQNVSIQMNGVK